MTYKTKSAKLILPYQPKPNPTKGKKMTPQSASEPDNQFAFSTSEKAAFEASIKRALRLDYLMASNFAKDVEFVVVSTGARFYAHGEEMTLEIKEAPRAKKTTKSMILKSKIPAQMYFYTVSYNGDNHRDSQYTYTRDEICDAGNFAQEFTSKFAHYIF